ncbi:MAG: hypothetical protein HZB13_21505 [Acidobacteria bacterium]|nr:hypothetical protein [Acidobacteriota bacterium]
MRRARLAWTVAAGLILLHGPVRAAEPDWIRVSTSNLELLTTGEAASAAEAVVELESLRSTFRLLPSRLPLAGTQVRIVAFSSEREYEPYRMNSFSPAYFVDGPGRLTIVLGRLAKENFPSLRHEYVHSLIRMRGWNLPLWLEEGLAEHFAGVSGETARMRSKRLTRGGLLALEALAAATRDSDSYTLREDALRFYGQSWALVDLLLTHPGYRGAAYEYIDRCAAGADCVGLMPVVFARSTADIERDLRDHVQRLRAGRLDDSPGDSIVETAPASGLEVKAALSEIRTVLDGGVLIAAAPAQLRTSPSLPAR